MDFFKELYNGDVYPAEEIAVDIAGDPKYKELSAKLSDAANIQIARGMGQGAGSDLDYDAHSTASLCLISSFSPA